MKIGICTKKVREMTEQTVYLEVINNPETK